MKTILLTGGSGFIGKNIMESYLTGKYNIVAPRRAELDCFDDESVARFFEGKHFDVVIHSAARPGHRNAGDTAGLLLTNSRMMANLLHHQLHWGKLLNIGSGAVYDMRHYEPKMPETYFGKHIPIDEHGYNKYLLGKMLPCLNNVYDLRLFGVFGKYEDYAIRFISNAICKSIFDLPITLRQDRKFDYLFIDDLHSILEYFIENSPAERAFNITPDEAVGLLEIAQIIKQVAGSKIPIQVATEELGMEYSGSNKLLRAHFPDVRFTPITQAVETLYKWYNENKQSLKKELLLTDK